MNLGLFAQPQQNKKAGWKSVPDLFIKGGNEQQPDYFAKKESTGGSSASNEGFEFSKDNQDEESGKEQYEQFFKRDPLIF